MRQASQSSWVGSFIFERRSTETEQTNVKENIVERKYLPMALSYVRLEKGQKENLEREKAKGQKIWIGPGGG